MSCQVSLVALATDPNSRPITVEEYLHMGMKTLHWDLIALSDKFPQELEHLPSSIRGFDQFLIKDVKGLMSLFLKELDNWIAVGPDWARGMEAIHKNPRYNWFFHSHS